MRLFRSIPLSRREMPRLLFLAAAWGLCVPTALDLQAQTRSSAAVSANVLSNRVAIGEYGTLIVKITGGDAELPETIPAQGLEITHSGQQSSIEIIEGVQTILTNHFYRFRGSEPGTYTIPSIPVELARQSLSTRAIEITVFERDEKDAVDATRPFFSKLELSRTEFYVNEIVPFTVTSYVRGRNAISDVVQPRLEHESFVIRGFREVRTDGGELGSTYYSSAALPSSLFALKPGEHRLGPAELGVRVLDSSTGFGFSSFFSRTILREMATNTVRVQVKPLPEGAPPSFGGGVGKFQLSVVPSTTQISVGDPISMTFEVTGTGNLETLSAPVFAIPQTDIWRSYEPSKTLDERVGTDAFDSATVTFNQVIIPETRVDAIPSFALTFFDPLEEKYVTRTTEPIPIEVSSDGSSSATPSIFFSDGAGTAEQAPSAVSPVARYDDMLHIRKRSPRWVAASDLSSGGILPYVVHGFLSLCFFTLIGFALVRWWREHRARPAVTGAPETYQEALSRIPRPGSRRRDYYRAVSTALECWREEHHEAPREVMDVIDRVSRKCDEFLYSGSTTTESPITSEEAAEFQSILQKLPRR